MLAAGTPTAAIAGTSTNTTTTSTTSALPQHQCDVTSGGNVSPACPTGNPSQAVTVPTYDAVRSDHGHATMPVDAWGYCRYVDNVSANTSIFVPFNTSTEWLAFINSAGTNGAAIAKIATLATCSRPWTPTTGAIPADTTSGDSYYCGTAVTLGSATQLPYQRTGDASTSIQQYTCTCADNATKWTETATGTFTAGIAPDSTGGLSGWPAGPTSTTWSGTVPPGCSNTNCAATTETWVVAGQTCSGPLAALNDSKTGTATSSNGNTGSANFLCTSGTLTQQTGATCALPVCKDGWKWTGSNWAENGNPTCPAPTGNPPNGLTALDCTTVNGICTAAGTPSASCVKTLYVTNNGGNDVYLFDSNGNYLSQFGGAGSGNGQFNYPDAGIAIDSDGNLLASDGGNYRVQKFDRNGNYLGKFGSQGSGNGQFGLPIGIAVDTSGSIYVADDNGSSSRIEKFGSNDAYIGQFGAGGSSNGQFWGVEADAIDNDGNIWVTDRFNNRVQKFDSNGNYVGQLGCASGACPRSQANGSFNIPWNVAVDPDGNLLVLDYNNGRIEKFDTSGNYLGQFGSAGSGNGQLSHPIGIAVDYLTGNIYVADTGNFRAEIFDKNGNYLSQFGGFGTASGGPSPDGFTGGPRGVAIGYSGNCSAP